MLKNYFKIAIKVLGRRKFFTAISLFGISFTLMILMIATAFFESELGNDAPLKNRDYLVYVPMVSISKDYQDTIIQVDTHFIDNIAKYDTTLSFEPAGRSMSRSSPSYTFLRNNLSDIPFVDKMSIFSRGVSYDIFINSKKVNFGAVFVDENYWDIYNFKFIDGQAFGKAAIDNQEQVAVISKKASLDYFGTVENVIDKEVMLDGKHYTVKGVIDSGISSASEINAEIYLPYTHVKPSDLKDKSFLGSFAAIFLAKDKKSVQKIKNEINQKEKRIEIPTDLYDYDKIDIEVMTFFERYAKGIISSDKPEESFRILFGVILFFLLLFFLLPTLNLININVSRILERSSEIGVRKAFGANSQNILLQFIFENIILTFIGGVLGFLFALIVIYLVNDSQILGDTTLHFNYKVSIYSFFLCLIFGIVSGYIPAWRMSRVHIVNALKQNQL